MQKQTIQSFLYKSRRALPLLFFILTLCIATNTYSKDYLHRVYSDTIDNYTYNGMTTWGDSSLIYHGINKTGFPKIIKSTNLGYTWDLVYTEWLGEDDYYSSIPFYNLGLIEHAAPGYTYLLYHGGGIKHLDERTGIVVDSLDFGFEDDSDYTLIFNMLDSINGIIFYRITTLITNDGWKTFKSIKNNGRYDENGELRGFGMGPSTMYMLTPDTVLFCGWSYIDSTSIDGLSFFRLIIEDDSIFKHEIYADTVLTYKVLGGIADFEYISDSLVYFIMSGRETGYGSCRELEIYKMTGPEHKITQIYRKSMKNFYGLSGLEFKDEMNGIATGNGIILQTSDGGDTWEIDTVFYTEKWEEFEGYWWAPRVDYVDNMIFIGTFNAGIWKMEDEKQSIKREKYNRPKIYPNPIQAGQILNIENRSFLHAKAYIYDIQGNEVDSFDFYGNMIPIKSSLPSGAYFLVVEENGKYPVREKFIVR